MGACRVRSIENRHLIIRERVEFLESSIGDNADKHGKASGGQGSLALVVGLSHSGIGPCRTLGRPWPSFERRTRSLSPIPRARRQPTRRSLAKTCRTAAANILWEPSLPRLTERLQYIEQLLGDSASKHAQDDGVFGGKQLTAHGS